MGSVVGVSNWAGSGGLGVVFRAGQGWIMDDHTCCAH